MGATEQRQALASYRDAATELRKAGEPLGDIEDAIDRDARAHLAALA